MLLFERTGLFTWGGENRVGVGRDGGEVEERAGGLPLEGRNDLFLFGDARQQRGILLLEVMVLLYHFGVMSDLLLLVCTNRGLRRKKKGNEKKAI